MPTPVVSVIMPVHNGEKYIAEAIDSICSQSLAEWELIIVNDGSTDQTQAIVNGYADPRIRLIDQENAGEANARNKALTHVSGKFLAFLDADDTLYPQTLHRLAEFLHNSPEYGAVYSDGYICDSNGDIVGKLSDCRPKNYQGNILEPLVLSSIVAATCCFMVRVELVTRHQLAFDEQLVIGPDWDFYIYVARTTQIGYLPFIACRYRMHGENISATSGNARRKSDLVKIREKVLMSDWFVELSDETKRSFFLDLLANLHRGTFSKQREVINSDQFNNLTGKLKAKLIYRTGITALVDGEKHHTLWCLRESLKQKVDLQALIAFGLILFFGLELTRKLVVVHQSYRRRRHVGSKNLDVSILLGINTPRE